MHSKAYRLIALIALASCTGGSGQGTSDVQPPPNADVGVTVSSQGGFGAGGAYASKDGGTVTSSDAAIEAQTGVAFSTNFDLTESPLSEMGAWKNLGLDWTWVATAGGYAFGTQTGNNGYNDSYAHLSGFPPNQSASAVIHIEPGITAAYCEVELLLRWSDSAHHAIGYECNLAHDGSYAQIIRWPGKLGTGLNDFAFLGEGSAPNGVHDGDVFSAQIVGNTITSYLNGKPLATASDSAVASGDPGIGFYWQGQAGAKSYSFTSFTAKALP